MNQAIFSHKNKKYLKQCILTFQQAMELALQKDTPSTFLFKICVIDKDAICKLEGDNIIYSIVNGDAVVTSPLYEKNGVLPHFPFTKYKYTLIKELSNDN